MGFYTHTQDPIGVFVEKDCGNFFEWSLNDDPFFKEEDFPHKIWVGDTIGSPYRYGIVKKMVSTQDLAEHDHSIRPSYSVLSDRSR